MTDREMIETAFALLRYAMIVETDEQERDREVRTATRILKRILATFPVARHNGEDPDDLPF